MVDERHNSFVAKIPKSPADSTSVSSIVHEGRILSQVQGDNVIQLVHFHDGTAYPELSPYLILEYAETNLLTIIGTRHQHYGFFEFPHLMAIFLDIAHRMRRVNKTVVHCDLRPSNILLCGKTLKIADFGVAEPISNRVEECDFRRYRRWDYVAPEYWDGTPSKIETDIYCGGLIFYELATLRYPYQVPSEGDDETAYRTAHSTGMAKNPTVWNDQITPYLGRVIMKMIEKDPEDRYHSWDDIIETLESIQKNRDTPKQ